jgi:hypothetical protein
MEALKFNVFNLKQFNFNRQSPSFIKSFFYFAGKPILLLPSLTIDLPSDKFLGDGLVMFSTCFVCLLDWFLLVSLSLFLARMSCCSFSIGSQVHTLWTFLQWSALARFFVLGKDSDRVRDTPEVTLWSQGLTISGSYRYLI